MKHFVSAAALGAAILSATPACAGHFLGTYTAIDGTPAVATLDIETSDVLDSVGGYDVLSIKGDIDGDEITGLTANPAQPFGYHQPAPGIITYDNVLYPNGPNLSGFGLLFRTAAGYDVNLFSDDATRFELWEVNAPTLRNSVGSFTVTPVPETATWAMMIVGFGMIGGALRKGRSTLVRSA